MSKKTEKKEQVPAPAQQQAVAVDSTKLYAITGETLLSIDNFVKNVLSYNQATQILALFKIEGEVNVNA